MYLVEILTSWGRTDGAPESDGGGDVAAPRALWINISASWLCFIYYATVIKGQYDADNDEAKPEATDDFTLYAEE